MGSQGGWGWLVVGAAFLVQVLTTGLQLAFGVMAAQIARHFSRQESTAASSLHMEAGQFISFLTTLEKKPQCPAFFNKEKKKYSAGNIFENPPPPLK